MLTTINLIKFIASASSHTSAYCTILVPIVLSSTHNFSMPLLFSAQILILLFPRLICSVNVINPMYRSLRPLIMSELGVESSYAKLLDIAVALFQEKHFLTVEFEKLTVKLLACYTAQVKIVLSSLK